MKKITLYISILLLVTSVTLIAQNIPEAVSPFESDQIINSLISGGKDLNEIDATLIGTLLSGGDRLVALQNPDGGWGWPLTGTTAANTIGPIGMGLAKACLQTQSLTQKIALQLTGDFLLAKTGNFSPSDGYLAKQLDIIFNVTTYTNHLKVNFYDMLAAGTYERAGYPSVTYTTASYIQRIRDNRSGVQANLAAWDIGIGLVAAAMCNASTTEWVDAVKAEINELDPGTIASPLYYDVIGLAGALYGLAYVNEEFDPTTGVHAAASNLTDLANILASYQLNSGGFTWSANYIVNDDLNEVTQETAYSILALNEVNRINYELNIQKAAGFLQSIQLATGGFAGDLVDLSENNEITAEAIWGIYVAGFNIYLSDDATVISDIIYPNTNWEVTAYEPNDWDFTTPVTFYIVPEVGSKFGACDITLEWDNTMFEFVSVVNDGIFNPYNLTFFQNQLGNTTRVTLNASRTDNINFNTVAGNYIAKLNLNILKPGYGTVNFTNMDFRSFNGVGGFTEFLVVGNSAQVKSYLGDVTAPSDPSTGDGLVNFEDLNIWSTSYWSGVSGYPQGMDNYKVKYDVGPTTTNTVYGLPIPDAKIQFEDLVIFAMSYGLSGDGVYPKITPAQQDPVNVFLGDKFLAGSETRIPLFISNCKDQVRAMSVVLSGTYGKFIGVEKGGLLINSSEQSVVLNRESQNSIFVDLSVIGANANGIIGDGEVINLLFEGNVSLSVASADLRNNTNQVLSAKLNGTVNSIPTEFGLNQNYPNPFNPATRISYQLPVQSMVTVSIYNSLGELVSTLVNEVKEAGEHFVDWNASSVSSGVYFYKIQSGDFTAVKKMSLLK